MEEPTHTVSPLRDRTSLWTRSESAVLGWGHLPARGVWQCLEAWGPATQLTVPAVLRPPAPKGQQWRGGEALAQRVNTFLPRSSQGQPGREEGAGD